MDKVYTCICGSQGFWIGDNAIITCRSCDRKYDLMWDVGIDGQMESPEEFNKRIKKELGK